MALHDAHAIAATYAMVAVSLSGLVYMLRGNRECVGILITLNVIRGGKGLNAALPCICLS